VSLETTSICVIDDKGTVVWRGKSASTPESITDAVQTYAPAAIRVGLETGQLSNWLTLNLRRRGLPVVCLDARHAKAALSCRLSDGTASEANDRGFRPPPLITTPANGRVGWRAAFRPAYSRWLC